jgi:hypothetical protein
MKEKNMYKQTYQPATKAQRRGLLVISVANPASFIFYLVAEVIHGVSTNVLTLKSKRNLI